MLPLAVGAGVQGARHRADGAEAAVPHLRHCAVAVSQAGQLGQADHQRRVRRRPAPLHRRQPGHQVGGAAAAPEGGPGGPGHHGAGPSHQEAAAGVQQGDPPAAPPAAAQAGRRPRSGPGQPAAGISGTRRRWGGRRSAAGNKGPPQAAAAIARATCVPPPSCASPSLHLLSLLSLCMRAQHSGRPTATNLGAARMRRGRTAKMAPPTGSGPGGRTPST